MNKVMGSFVLAVVLFVGGCSWHRHKTFDEKFEYKSSKVMNHIEKVVSDKGKLERIEKKILAYKPKLKGLFENMKEGKGELKSLLIKAKDKGEVKARLKSLADKKVDTFNMLIDLVFEIKAELSGEEWNKLADAFSKKCSYRWK